MTLIEWKESFSVGIDILDEQHKGLIKLLNAMLVHTEDDSESSFLVLLHEMTRYAEEHFYTEETLFSKNHYPYTAQHIAEHQEFLREIEDKLSRLDEKDTVLCNELIEFLQKWLIEHILGSDQDYRPFIS